MANPLLSRCRAVLRSVLDLLKSWSRSSLQLLLRLWRSITALLSGRRTRPDERSPSDETHYYDKHLSGSTVHWAVAPSRDHSMQKSSSGALSTTSTGPLEIQPVASSSSSPSALIQEGLHLDTTPKRIMRQNTVQSPTSTVFDHESPILKRRSLHSCSEEKSLEDEPSDSTHKWCPCLPDNSLRYTPRER